MRRSLARLARMGVTELAWRGRAETRVALDRARLALTAPRWNRRDLAPRLTTGLASSVARAALLEGRWNVAHEALMGDIVAAGRFVITPRTREPLVDLIRREFPGSAAGAAARADRIVSGEYDLLGYQGLRFGHAGSPVLPAAAGPDWHYDPIHDRRAPRRFWTSVPYLDASCGDHKIIWELNRHQHWLTLGRAFWLTGDRRYREAFLRELTSWLEHNPPLVGINWASMLELAFRSISWIWALHFFSDGPAEARRPDTAPWTVDLLLGLDLQLTQIERNLSYYFSPNTHLLGEGLALYVAGRTLPMLRASARREGVGRDVLVREIRHQIAPDGGHCERSAHYHRYALDFYLLALAVARITDDPVAPELERAAARLASAARLLADARGYLPHLGDDDGGTLTPLTGRAADDVRDSLATAAVLLGRPDLHIETTEETYWHVASSSRTRALGQIPAAACAGPLASNALVDTGYYVSRSPGGDHLVIDGGPHGFQNGGHAHADALSVTFARRSAPLLIDPGTACYTIDPDLRDRFRSTAMHNTIVVDDRSQSMSNGPFHWMRTARATVRLWHADQGFDYFEGTHDGYSPTLHRRHVLSVHDDLLVVADLVEGTGAHRASAHWHVDPRWHVEVGGRRALLVNADDRVELAIAEGGMDAVRGESAAELGCYSPTYGRVDPATTIRITREGTGPMWIASVFGLNARNPVRGVETVPVRAEAGMLAESIALRIWREESIDYFLVAEPRVTSRSGPTPCARSVWRVADIETDARVLLCRLPAPLTTLAVVEGTIVRAAGGTASTRMSTPRRGHPAPDHEHQTPGTRYKGLLCVESPAS